MEKARVTRRDKVGPQARAKARAKAKAKDRDKAKAKDRDKVGARDTAKDKRRVKVVVEPAATGSAGDAEDRDHADAGSTRVVSILQLANTPVRIAFKPELTVLPFQAAASHISRSSGDMNALHVSRSTDPHCHRICRLTFVLIFRVFRVEDSETGRFVASIRGLIDWLRPFHQIRIQREGARE